MKVLYNKISKNEIEVGLDEAGRGPLIGRVYAAVVNWGDRDTRNVSDKLTSDRSLRQSNLGGTA